jgi:hypothetical protein
MARAKQKAETPGGAKAPRKRGPRAPERSDDANAFIPDPGEGPARTKDDLAELLAEDFVESATRGNAVLEDDLDQPLADEIGGPFVMTRAREEFAEGTDDSNPPDAEAEALPKPVAGLVQRPRAEALDEEDEDDEDSERRVSNEDDDDVAGLGAEGLEDEGEDEDDDEDDDEDEGEDDDDDRGDEQDETDEIEALGDEENPDELDDGTRLRTR